MKSAELTGLNETTVAAISEIKNEPGWMRDFRIKSLRIFESKPMPAWGPDLSELDFNSITYYLDPSAPMANSWEDLPPEILETYQKLGLPKAEQERLVSGVMAQFESEAVYSTIQSELTDQGVIFMDTDTALKEHPEIFREHFATVVPAGDNKFSALNSAVWSGGSFLYVPPNTHVEIPLQAYFRINSEAMGQFERTLIIVEEGSSVHYTEGCTSPVYTTASLHSAVVEVIVKDHAKCRYTTIQNWTNNVYNLVTKRAKALTGAHMSWCDANLGCLKEGSLIETNKGLIPIEEINIGDTVKSLNNNNETFTWSVVTGKKFSGIREVYPTQTEKNKTLWATKNHPFYAPLQKGTNYVARENLTQVTKINGSLPYGEPYQLQAEEEKQTTIEFMWIAGLFSRCGRITENKVTFTLPVCSEAQKQLLTTMNIVFPALKHVTKAHETTWSNKQLRELFTQNGFTNNAIPRWVNSLPASQRKAFIEGHALDTTGQISSGDIQQLESIQEILLTLGISSNIKDDNGGIKETVILGDKQNDKNSFVLSFTGFGESVKSAPESVQINANQNTEMHPTWDIEVDNHNFVANGFIVHNSKINEKYPAVWLLGPHASGEVLSMASAGAGQHQDTGAKMLHFAPFTTSNIVSKSISYEGGRTSYRGLVQAKKTATSSKSSVQCDALLLDAESRTDTYPYMDIRTDDLQVEHEATVSKIGEEQLFYLMSRGLTETEAKAMIVNGFISPVAQELPMEYALELNKLIQMNMEGSVG